MDLEQIFGGLAGTALDKSLDSDNYWRAGLSFSGFFLPTIYYRPQFFAIQTTRREHFFAVT